LVQTPPLFSSEYDQSAVQEGAASALILGLELFYPTSQKRTQLLVRLLALAGTDLAESEEWDMKSQSRTSAQRSGKESFSFIGKAAAVHFLLVPLLGRLSEEALGSRLVPASDLSPGELRDAETAQPVVLLLSLLKLLIDRVQTLLQSPYYEEPVPSNGKGQNGSSEASLVVSLLLLLTKHLISWAASWPVGGEDELVDSDIHSLQEEEDFSVRARSLVHLCIRGLSYHTAQLSAPWWLLLEFCETLFDRAATFLRERESAEAVGAAEIKEVEQSIVGALLPAVATALLPLSNLPSLPGAVPSRLLPRVSDTLSCLVSICQRSASLHEALAHTVQSFNAGTSTSAGIGMQVWAV